MMKSFLEAQRADPTFMQQQDDLDYALIQRRRRRFWTRLRNFVRRHGNEFIQNVLTG